MARPDRLRHLTRTRRPARGRQLRLLLAVLRRLTEDWWSVYELCEEVRVCTRTVWRVLAAIRAEGLPLERVLEDNIGYFRLRQRWWEHEEPTPRRGRR